MKLLYRVKDEIASQEVPQPFGILRSSQIQENKNDHLCTPLGYDQRIPIT